MPKISALLHTHNDGLRLGRALQSLRPCDEVLVVDDWLRRRHAKVARDHGATVRSAIPGVTPGAYVMDASHDWILCLRPNESLSDDLEAALFEWKDQEPEEGATCYKVPDSRRTRRQLARASAGGTPGQPQADQLDRRAAAGSQNCDATLSGHLLCFHQP